MRFWCCTENIQKRKINLIAAGLPFITVFILILTCRDFPLFYYCSNMTGHFLPKQTEEVYHDLITDKQWKVHYLLLASFSGCGHILREVIWLLKMH